MKKIVITGGHPSPALAVIDQIKATKPHWQIYFVGVKHSLSADRAIAYEFKEIRRRQIPFYNITTSKLSGPANLAALNLLRLPVGFVQSLKWLLHIRPNLILTFGGYIGIPVALAASILQIPLVIHEQSLRMGKANRLMAKLATKIFVSWPQTIPPQAGTKFILTGLPLRKAAMIAQSRRPDFAAKLVKINKPLLYVTGGSQGAHFINRLIEETVAVLLNKFKIIHQAGESTQFNDLPRLQKKQRDDYIVVPHIASANIGWILHRAAMIVSRAGMNTICELLYWKKHAVLIPLPQAINAEQTENAQLYRQSGLGRVLKQEHANPDQFLATLTDLWNHIQNQPLQTIVTIKQKQPLLTAAENMIGEIEQLSK